MHWKKNYVTHFIVIFTLFQWSETKYGVSLRYAYISPISQTPDYVFKEIIGSLLKFTHFTVSVMGSPSCPKPYPWCAAFLHPWLLINLKSTYSTPCIHEDCLLCKPMLLAQILILTSVSLIILPLVFPWLPPTQTLPLQSRVPAKMKRQPAHGSSCLKSSILPCSAEMSTLP